MRRKQLHVLFTALHQLQSSLDSTSEANDTSDGHAPVIDISDGDSKKGLVDLTEDLYTDMDCS